MKVGWLADPSAYTGGAELTQADFRAAAPDGVEIIDCPPGGVAEDLDLYVANNVTAYTVADVEPISELRWYHHDLSPHIDPGVREILNGGRHIFCSPAQRDRYGIGGELVPPPLDPGRFKPPRQSAKRREGTCSIASWQNPGKGAVALSRWAQANEPVAVYGDGPFAPRHPAIDYKGGLEPGMVAQTLWRYQRFVFLPFAFEPFCRCVVEAQMAGCEVVTNGLVGGLYWLKGRARAIETAAEDFWRVVLA